jgi:hypothetical protein
MFQRELSRRLSRICLIMAQKRIGETEILRGSLLLFDRLPGRTNSELAAARDSAIFPEVARQERAACAAARPC